MLVLFVWLETVPITLSGKRLFFSIFWSDLDFCVWTLEEDCFLLVLFLFRYG